MKSVKVITRITGGIGNQLFCYAFARALSLRNRCELVIDDTSGFLYDKKFKRTYQLHRFNVHGRRASRFENFTILPRGYRFVVRFCCKYVSYPLHFSYVQQQSRDYDSNLKNLVINKTVYLEGYWQSERYFLDFESIIRKDLAIKPPTDSINEKCYDQITSQNSVAIHLRFFEKPNENQGSNNAPGSYYSRAIEKMEGLLSNPHYFVFSDDPNAASNLLSLGHDRVTYISHNDLESTAYADLWLMASCKHFIIANSTFSWWGAWLSENDKKIVIAPDLIISNGSGWGFKGLIPDNWIKM